MLLISYNAQNRPAAESWLSSQRIINSAELRNPASGCEGTPQGYSAHISIFAGVMHKVTKYEMTCVQSIANGAGA